MTDWCDKAAHEIDQEVLGMVRFNTDVIASIIRAHFNAHAERMLNAVKVKEKPGLCGCGFVHKSGERCGPW